MCNNACRKLIANSKLFLYKTALGSYLSIVQTRFYSKNVIHQARLVCEDVQTTLTVLMQKPLVVESYDYESSHHTYSQDNWQD